MLITRKSTSIKRGTTNRPNIVVSKVSLKILTVKKIKLVLYRPTDALILTVEVLFVPTVTDIIIPSFKSMGQI